MRGARLPGANTSFQLPSWHVCQEHIRARGTTTRKQENMQIQGKMKSKNRRQKAKQAKVLERTDTETGSERPTLVEAKSRQGTAL